MKNSFLSCIFFVFFIIKLISANDFGQISGTIRCIDSNHPLIAVNVYLKNTHIGAASNKAGYYRIQNIPPGKYEILVEIIGYTTLKSKSVEIRSGENIELDFILKPETLYFKKGVTVTATRGHSLISEVPSSVDVIDEEDQEHVEIFIE